MSKNKKTLLGKLTKEERDYLLSFKGVEVHCIKDFKLIEEVEELPSMSLNFNFVKGNFYEINMFLEWEGLIIKVTGCELYYEKFLEHFELKSIQDVRKRKIESVLNRDE